MDFSCGNCSSAVWFDYLNARWKHARKPPTRCKSPFPRHPSDPVR